MSHKYSTYPASDTWNRDLIGWRSEEGQTGARTRGYCLLRKQVKRTQDSEANMMNCKRYLVLSN